MAFAMISTKAFEGMHSTTDRTPTTAPTILPIPESVDRPLWSVMIPVYNCAEYIPDALTSVLAQDPGPEVMQIQVVDDASTDTDVESLVLALGKGRVEYYRQPSNKGSLRNFETCINRAKGHLVHLLHGDDRVTPGFYSKMTRLLNTYPQVGAAFSHYAFIDDAGNRTHLPPPEALQEGILDNWLLRIAQYQRIQYVSIVVRREVYETVSSFYGTNYGEDWEMWVRIARYYPIAYTPEVLAEYRGRTNSISWEKARSGCMVPDLIHVMDRIQHHLPEKDKVRIAKLSRKYYAYMSIGTAYEVLKETRDWSLAQMQIRQSLDLSKHPSIYFHLLKFYVKSMIKKIAVR